jgi:hypothetical protein
MTNVIRFPGGRASSPPSPTVDALQAELVAAELELLRARLAQVRSEHRQGQAMWVAYCARKILFWGLVLWLLAAMFGGAKASAQEAIARSRIGNVLTFVEPVTACRDFAEARAASFGNAADADSCTTFTPEGPVRIVKLVPADRFQRRVWLCVITDAPVFSAPVMKNEVAEAEARGCYWIHANARPRG